MRIYTVIAAAVFTALCSYQCAGVNRKLIGDFSTTAVKSGLFVLTALIIAALGTALGLGASALVNQIGLFLSTGILLLYTITTLIKRLGKNGVTPFKPVTDLKTFLLVSVLTQAEIFPTSFAVGILFRPFWAVPLAFAVSAWPAYMFSRNYRSDSTGRILLIVSGLMVILAVLAELILNLL